MEKTAIWVIHKTVIGEEFTVCSECNTDFSFRTRPEGKIAKMDLRGVNFCPQCGARIIGEKEAD